MRPCTFITFTFVPLIACIPVVLSDFSFVLLHNNDMHARFLPTSKSSGTCANSSSSSCYGGFARVKSVVDAKTKEAAARGLSTVFLNAGDTFQGTAYYTFFKWPIVAELINMLGVHVMCLGNHEFDDGVAGLAPFIANISVPTVCANCDFSQEPSLITPNLTPSYVLTVNGTKIGIIGYLTPDTKTLSSTGHVVLKDEVNSISAEAQRLIREEGVSILIALGHSGYARDLEIAAQVGEIDLVVGGHSHTFLYNGTVPDAEAAQGPYPTVVTQSSGKQVPVVQAYYATKYLGYLELTFDDSGNLKTFSGQPILLSGSYSQDSAIVDALVPYETSISKEIQTILGYTSVLLDDVGWKCALEECNIGNLIADAYVDYVYRNLTAPEGSWTAASIALQHSGGIKTSINTETNVNHNGSITVDDLISVMPYAGNLAVIKVNGSVLLEALEFSVHRYQLVMTGHVNEFLQLSGLRVEYDVNRTSGNRVVSVAVLCADCTVPQYQPLQLNKTYSVVLPQYLSGGGDNYTMLVVDDTTVLDTTDYAAVAEYIQHHSPINPAVENRSVIFMDLSASSAPVSVAMSRLSGLIATLSLMLYYFY